MYSIIRSAFNMLGMACILATGSAFAEGKVAAGNAVCVVDMQRVVKESVLGKAAMHSLEVDMQQSKSKVEVLKNDLLKMREDLKKQSAILSQEALANKADLVRQKERAMGLALQDLKQEFMRKNNAAVGRVVKETNSALEGFSGEKRCQIVLERGRNFVVYMNKRPDVTDAVIKKLDQKGEKK